MAIRISTLNALKRHKLRLKHRYIKHKRKGRIGVLLLLGYLIYRLRLHETLIN